MDKLEMIKQTIWDWTDGEAGTKTKIRKQNNETKVIMLGTLLSLIVGILDNNIIINDDDFVSIINQTEAIATCHLMTERIS